MGNILIKSVTLSADGVLYVEPKGAVYDKIYRSAMGVNWDSAKRSLYFHMPSNGEPAILDDLKIILSAVKNEYGDALIVSSETEFIGIDKDIVSRFAVPRI